MVAANIVTAAVAACCLPLLLPVAVAAAAAIKQARPMERRVMVQALLNREGAAVSARNLQGLVAKCASKQADADQFGASVGSVVIL